MMLRPGMKHLGSTASDAKAYYVPFIFATNDAALLEFTNTKLRIWKNDVLLTRPSVSSAVTNGTFTSDITGWTDNDDAGGTSVFVTGGFMGLNGNGVAFAKRDQEVTVSGGDISTVHALDIVIERGPVLLRVGSTLGDDDYIAETVLLTGTHSLAFTPTGNFHIRFLSSLKRQTLVDSCDVCASGTLTLTSPYLTADLSTIRHDQSGDVVFIANFAYKQRRVERRDNDSWSLVEYDNVDGPFLNENVGPTTMLVGALSGNTTLTASNPYFKIGNIGSLFRVTSQGQAVTQDATAENTFTDAIRVTGVGSTRAFQHTLAGTWVATVTLQRSLTSATGPWEDLTPTFTTNGTRSFNDGFDNLIVWYRIGVKTGDFTSSTPEINMDITYSVGSVDGVCRVTGFTSSTVVSVGVIEHFGDVTATDLWAEGRWSDRRGFATSVGFVEGRLGWSGGNGVQLSVSDAFNSFDEDIEGDSGPIVRTIGSGPVDVVSWMIALQRLILGAEGAEHSVRSSSFDEPLTPSQFLIKDASTQGSALVAAVKIDDSVMFVQKSGERIFELKFESGKGDYSSKDITIHAPEIGQPSIIKLAVQRQPDTRMHGIRSDGKAVILLWDAAESILCWVTIETDGVIEDVVILPGDEEDQVYYVVKRVINSSTVRFLEKWSQEKFANGGTTIYNDVSVTVITDLDYRDGTIVTIRDSAGVKVENLTVTGGSITLSVASTYANITPAAYELADAFLRYSGSAVTTITGLTYLEAELVSVFADGKDRGTFTVASGQIVLPEAVEEAVIGMIYTARFKSTKLAYAAAGVPLTQKKGVSLLGLVMRDVHVGGLTYGPNFDTLDNLPMVEAGADTDADHVRREYDSPMTEFQPGHGTDARGCLQAANPRPCTMLAAVIAVATHDKV